MQLEVGSIIEGKVVKITKFGVFVELESKLSGLVHISEISNFFVVDISNFLDVGDTVKVKVLNITDGKISLSIKQAQNLLPKKKLEQKEDSKQQNTKLNNQNPAIFSKLVKKETNLSFEEMLNKFKKSSEEKLANIKRNSDNKRSSYSKRH